MTLFPITDEQAMWRVQTRDDPEAFARLVERWQGPIRSLCARMLGDAHRGEDLAQETFARLFVKRKEYQLAGRFSTYLWRIALNLCYDELRKIRRQPPAQAGPADDPGAGLEQLPDLDPPPDARLEASERAGQVRRALLELPEVYRAVLVLRHYQGLKFREIADALEIPEGTVKSRMAEGLALLERNLNRHSKEPSWNHRKPTTEILVL